MEQMKRFAVYYAPEPGKFADAAAQWLGWDPQAGRRVVQPAPELAGKTAEPARYGFHGTIKPPFRLTEGMDLVDLHSALHDLAAALQAVEMPGLNLVQIDGFMALVPQGDLTTLNHLAARVVEGLEPFRAPLNDAEIARRRPERLTPRQRALLDQFGYPYVMEEFRFHLTLTDRLTEAEAGPLRALALAHFGPHLPRPFRLTELCLFGEARDGHFHQLHRYPLAI
jgi:putative phosphonate metabolism protein